MYTVKMMHKNTVYYYSTPLNARSSHKNMYAQLYVHSLLSRMYFFYCLLPTERTENNILLTRLCPTTQ
jgi:hypothetical protein